MELNAGQMVEDVRLAVECKVPVEYFGRLGGIVPDPDEVVTALKEKLLNNKRMNTNLIRNILNIIFMVLALAAVLTYFFVSDFKVFIYVCAAAIFTKLIEFFYGSCVKR